MTASTRHSALMARVELALQRNGIVEAGDLDGCSLRRTYAGHVQRSHGAWVFYVVDAHGRDVLGSQWPATAIARAREGQLVKTDDGSIMPTSGSRLGARTSGAARGRKRAAKQRDFEADVEWLRGTYGSVVREQGPK